MRVVGPAHIEAVRLDEALRIAVRGTKQQDHRLARPHSTPAHLQISHGEALHVLHRCVVTQHLLDGSADQRRLIVQPVQLVRIAQQREHAVRDQVDGGLDTCTANHQLADAIDVGRRQVVAGVLGGDQL